MFSEIQVVFKSFIIKAYTTIVKEIQKLINNKI